MEERKRRRGRAVADGKLTSNGRPRIHPSIVELAVPISRLKPWPQNPRNGDIDVIAESLDANSQYRPIVVATGETEPALKDTVLAGNHTYFAAGQLGWDEVAVTWWDGTYEEATRVVLVDNRAGDLAWNDDAVTVELLKGLGVSDEFLRGTGFDERAANELIAKQELPEDFKEYDESAADEVKKATCPNCGEEFAL